MDLTSKVLREAEFREKRGGYHPEDVDRLLEEAADGVDLLHERLRQAVERAQKAEAAAADSGGTDESLKRTLVLAQRTADMAIQEAREQASHIVAAAEQQAQALLGEAEERARRAHEDAISKIRSELTALEAVRERGQREVDILNRWVEEHRSHLASNLKEALGIVERAGTLSPAPSSHPIDVGPREPAEPAISGPVANQPVASRPLGGAPADAGDARPAVEPTAAWSAPAGSRGPDTDKAQSDEAQSDGPSHTDDRAEAEEAEAGEENGEARHFGASPAAGASPEDPTTAMGPDEQAIANFFDGDALDDDDETESRFGGRLRRRR